MSTDWDTTKWDERYVEKLQIYSRILSNPYISPEEVISIAYYRVIRYGKTTPDTLWVPLALHVAVETKKRIRRLPEESFADDAVHYDATDDKILLEELLSHVSKFERFLLVKHFADGNTYEELGLALGVSWGTVRNRILAAIDKIRKHIGVDDE